MAIAPPYVQVLVAWDQYRYADGKSRYYYFSFNVLDFLSFFPSFLSFFYLLRTVPCSAMLCKVVVKGGGPTFRTFNTYLTPVRPKSKIQSLPLTSFLSFSVGIRYISQLKLKLINHYYTGIIDRKERAGGRGREGGQIRQGRERIRFIPWLAYQYQYQLVQYGWMGISRCQICTVPYCTPRLGQIGDIEGYVSPQFPPSPPLPARRGRKGMVH